MSTATAVPSSSRPKLLPVHLMIDIETAGLKAGCPVLQIGAIPLKRLYRNYSPTSSRPFFYSGISLRSNEAAGLAADKETLAWWSKQDSALFDEVFSGTGKLKEILEAFHLYCTHLIEPEEELIVWCCGTDFDFPILEAAFVAVGVPVPWKYHAKRDYRTVREQLVLPASTLATIPANPIKHNAFADAEYQARMLVVTHEYLLEQSNGRISLL